MCFLTLMLKIIQNKYADLKCGHFSQGRNQDFAKEGGLKMEKSCGVILMTI